MRDWDEEHLPPGQRLTGTWAAVLRDVRSLALDLTVAGAQTARQVPLPSIDELATGWSRVEDAVLREMKARLDQLDDQDRRPRYRPGEAPAGSARTAAQLLDDLLAGSLEMDSIGSREELYRTLLRQLVPDEARILAALADGSRYPLVHVRARGNGARVLLANASTVGRAAGVQVPEATSAYVGHLRALALAEEGPADDSLAEHYDILLGEPIVRQAEQEPDVGRLGTRIIRRTLRISPLGRQLWRACRPRERLEPESAPPDAEPPASQLPSSPRLSDRGNQPSANGAPPPSSAPAAANPSSAPEESGGG